MGCGIRIVPKDRQLVAIGDRYSRLTVIGEPFYMKQISHCVVQCDCGSSPRVVSVNALRTQTKSCGCLQKEAASNSASDRRSNIIVSCEACNVTFRVFPSERNSRRFCSKTCANEWKTGRPLKHGESQSRLHQIWCHMKTRCNAEGVKEFEYYGGRGIRVCDEWSNSFEAFRDWAMRCGYSDLLTIDRINVNGHYEPSNCRWITQTKQNLNKRKRRDAQSSKFIGVSWCANAGKWRAQTTRERKNIHIGIYATELTAALAYDDFVYALDPEFVRLNFPERKRQKQDT